MRMRRSHVFGAVAAAMATCAFSGAFARRGVNVLAADGQHVHLRALFRELLQTRAPDDLPKLPPTYG